MSNSYSKTRARLILLKDAKSNLDEMKKKRLIDEDLARAQKRFSLDLARELFDLIDADKSGTIEIEELDHALEKLMEKKVGVEVEWELVQLLSNMDSDGNGVVDFEERHF